MKRGRTGTSSARKKTSKRKGDMALLKENAELRGRLEDIQEALRAVKAGEVDALFLDGQIYSLQGAETPYRILVESMNEGAATLTPDGVVLYCNLRLGTLLDTPLDTLIGSQLRQRVDPLHQKSFDALLGEGRAGLSKGECTFLVREGGTRTIQCSFSPIKNDPGFTICLVATDLTDRKLAEDARFGSVLASIGDAVVATDLNGMITFLNNVAEKLTGWTLAESAMKPAAEVFRVINEHTRAPVENPILRVLKTGKTARLEDHAFLVTKDGREIPIDDSAAPILDLKGNVTGVVLVFRDVTERREKERAFRESQAMLHAVVNGVGDPIYMKDRESRLVMANPAAVDVIGKPLEAIIGKTDAEFLSDPALGRAIMENDRRIVETGQYMVFEETALTPRGYRSMLSSKTPWRDSDGKIVGLLGISRDITERKEAEEHLRRSESEYRLLFEFNPQPMWMVDKETFKFLAVNEAALAQYGFSREEFLALTIFDLVHADHHGLLRKAFAEKWDQASLPTVYTHIRRDQARIKVEVVSRDVLYEGKSVRLTQGQDVTHRIAVEEALEENLKLFQAFVESSLEPSLMIDEKGIILAASRSSIAMLCSSHSELIGQNILRLVPSEQLPILERSYDTLMRDPLRPRIAMVRIRLMDGTSLWVEALCSMLRIDERVGGYIINLKRLQVGVLKEA